MYWNSICFACSLVLLFPNQLTLLSMGERSVPRIVNKKKTAKDVKKTSLCKEKFSDLDMALKKRVP